MTVYVVAAAVGQDLIFRFATEKHPMSSLFTLVGEGQRIGGNPYLIYATTIHNELKTEIKDKLSMNIKVFQATSGELN